MRRRLIIDILKQSMSEEITAEQTETIVEAAGVLISMDLMEGKSINLVEILAEVEEEITAEAKP